MNAEVPRGPAPSNCVIRVPAMNTYSTDGSTVMGRQSANEGFLRAWFEYSGQSDFYCLARHKDEAQLFASKGQAQRPGAQGLSYRWISQLQMHRIASIGCAFLPGPQVAEVAWLRRRDALAQAHDFSLIGMTHTTCELPIQDGLASMLTAPVYPWDAQICPSVSVRDMVSRLLDDEEQWLRERLGAAQVVRPQLPVLPLGVHVDDFDLPPVQSQALRTQWRQRWGLEQDDVAVLYVGRLDLLTKANLFPLFDALELAARELRQRTPAGPQLTLVLAGWFNGAWNEQTIREGVLEACPSVRVVFEDGRPLENRRAVWQACDVFSSLVDNIQETFGLTPIEAMAAGLPVVVTDYDGYKESVRDGVDGFRIRTWQPRPGSGLDLMDRHADLMDSYANYVGRASALVGVDVGQAAAAFVRLAQDPALRQRMGQQGRHRARTQYDWRVLIPRYQDLFAALARLRSQERQSSGHGWKRPGQAPQWGLRQPRRSDPFHSFSHYPSAVLGPDEVVGRGPGWPVVENAAQQFLRRQLSRPVYRLGGQAWPLDEAFLAQVVRVMESEQGPWTVRQLLTQVLGESSPPQQAFQAERQLGWLIKTGLMGVSTTEKPRSLSNV